MDDRACRCADCGTPGTPESMRIRYGMWLCNVCWPVSIYENCLQGLRPSVAQLALDAIPTNWCDPLLSGPGAIKIPAGCPDIEKLLLGVRERVRRAVSATPANEP